MKPSEPRAEFLTFPEGYGTAKTKLAWGDIRTDLEQSQHYWVATVRDDGRPHVVPLDGLWIDDVLYYGGSDETIHRRNLLANPEVVVTLPDTVRAVILEGGAGPAEPSPELTRTLADGSKEKYGYDFEPSFYEGALAFRPRRALAWREFPTDATRFLFH